MNGSTVGAAHRAAPTWRLRPWPRDRSIAHLVLVDHNAPPSDEAVGTALEEAIRLGFRSIRTSAMFPAAADAMLRHGFVPIETLALLRLDLARAPLVEVRRVRTHPVRRWHHEAVGRLDTEAFGAGWGNDGAAIAEIRTATPSHRARLVRDRGSIGRITGFAISGAAGEVGYLQRLAVAPAHRRHGIAAALVADALSWVQRTHRTSVLVNTGIENGAALALYARFGFERTSDVLVVAEHRIA